jgi:hypothetical protein
MSKTHRRNVALTERPMAAPVRETVAVDRRDLSELTERLASLELALEDAGWQRLTGETEREFSRDGLRQICDLALLAWLKNPLIKRGVSVQAHYVFGQGVSIRADDAVVNEVVQAFLDDSKNQTELTSHQAMMTKEQELAVYANLFFVLFTNKATGRVRVRTISFDELVEILCNPQDSKDPWFYKRSWTELDLAGLSSVRTAYYPDWRYRPTGADRVKALNGSPVEWDTPVYHVAVNKLSTMRFGVSEVYAAVDWAKAYKSFLEDWATLTRAYSRFAYKLTTPGGKTGIAAAKTKLATTYGLSSTETNPAPTTGATFISGENVKLDPMRIGGANVSADDGRRMLLMVAAAMGLPETFFGDTSVGTLATAKSLDRPTELQMRNRQTLWTDVFTAILGYVIEQAVRARTLKGTITEDDDGTPVVELETVDDPNGGDPAPRDASVSVTFPPILEHDVAANIEAIVNAATLGGSGTLAGTIPDVKTLSRMLLTALGEPDVDAMLDAMFPEDEGGEAPATEARMVKAARTLREAMREFVERHADAPNA